MRKAVPILAILAVSACNPTVPDSGAGVGFGDYEAYQRQSLAREARLTGAPLAPDGPAISPETPAAGQPLPTAPGAPLSAVGTESLTQPGRPDVIAAAEGAIAEAEARSGAAGAQVVIDANNPGISNTQSFEAVTERETIESDAERLRAQRENYVVIDPEPLPRRRTEVNIAEYALSATNAVGEKLYRRGPLSAAGYRAKCARYQTPDDAQTAFLEAGGPRRDRLGLDPDGDGFACDWSPEVFRRMLN